MRRHQVLISVISVAVCHLLLVMSSVAWASEQVSITLQYRPDRTGSGLVDEWIREFERNYPHISVKWQVWVGGWQNKLLTEMLAGTAPDVFEFWSPFNQQLRQRGLLLNLTPYTKTDFTAQDIADFYPSVWETSFTRVGPQAGSQFIMPRYINVTVFHYNVEGFREAGIADPLERDSRGEWTWDLLRETARKLTRRDENQVTQYGAMLGINALPRVLNWIWGAGGDLIDPRDPRKFVGDTPEAEAGVQFLHTMIWEDGSASPSWGHTGFLNGTIPIIEEGMQAIFEVFAKTIGDAFAWNSVRRPKGPAGRAGYLVDDSFGIWADSPHPAEAWKLLEFLVSRQGQEIMVKHSGLPPVRRSAARAYLNLAPNHNLTAFAEAVMDGRPTIYTRMQGDVSQIHSTLWSMLTPVLNNTQPYRVAVEGNRPKIEALIAGTSN
jgi:multiple sugar transport system substrate-binding protein